MRLRHELLGVGLGACNAVHYRIQNYRRLMVGCPTIKQILRNHRKRAKNRAKKTV